MSTIGKCLLNPLSIFSDKTQNILGCFILIFNTIVCYYVGVDQDGIFHSSFSKQSIWFICITTLLVNLLPTLIIFLISKIINKHTRIVDVWHLVLFARFPLLVYSSIFYLIVGPELISQLGTENFQDKIKTDDVIRLSFSGLLGLVFLVYSIIILIKGFKTTVNAKKVLPYIGLVVAVILSEIIYRYTIYPFFFHYKN